MSEYTIREQAYTWLVQKQEQAFTDHQQQAFNVWLNAAPEHAIAFAEAELMWRALADEKVSSELQTLPLDQFQAKSISCWQQVKLWFGDQRFIWLGAVTASVFLFMLLQQHLLPISPEQPQLTEAKYSQNYQTALAESREVLLDDGSKVVLDANSAIEVSYNQSQRHVLLARGSAFFAVSHEPSRPFIVASGAVEVEVTGTEFDVQRKQNTVYVAVEQGSVNVSQPLPGWKEKTAAKNNQSWNRRKGATLANVSLSAGQGIKAHRLDGLGQVEHIAPEFLAAWRKGKLVYINRSLGEVVQDMNRYSQIPLHVSPEARELKLSGTFDSGDIPAMLKVMETALPIALQQQPKQVNIRLR